MHRTSPAAALFALGLSLLAGASPQAQEPLGAAERDEIDFTRRRGELATALSDLDGVLTDTPDDVLSRALRVRCRQEATDYAGALEDAQVVLTAVRGGALEAADAARCARTWLELVTELGRAGDEPEALAATIQALQPERDGRDALALGRALASLGRRAEARAAFQKGAQASAAADWEALLARARCERALGFFERAAKSLVAADEAARGRRSRSSSEPDVLIELGDVYFETYGEVDDAVSKAHSPGELVKEALALNRDHEGARVLLWRLHRWNWQRTSQSPDEILQALFAAHPDSIEGLLARASGALDDGELPAARRALERLARLAPGRREVRTEQAALAWIEHRRDEANATLAALVAADPADSKPELLVGWHLLELYRFAEALGFLERAVERDPRDWMAWIQLGRARANTGDEDRAREAFARSNEVGEGRRNAWRDNSQLVLKRMKESMVLEDHGELRFLWRPEEGAVLTSYLPEFYGKAREELAARYGHTPGVTQIEVFRDWRDFSVRSTGFEGYPALGVCFGPVVTAVSPLSELRGTFSWARTSFHEFTHVIHLGLSNNRCPRWITEGLATWEEGARRPSWWRNMRRDLVDARANGEVLPLRKLNNAFRGPRVLFAYYQSGLLCQMLIEQSGFPPIVRLLEAFDRGADLDGAFREVFQRTPEEIDAQFAARVDKLIAPLAIEPRWSPELTLRTRFALSRQLPAEPAAKGPWALDWCKVAWGSYLAGKRLDAEESLRLAGLAGPLPPRGEFLRGELFLAQGAGDDAAAAFRAGIERGGNDYRAHMALGSLLARRSKATEALEEFAAAEKAFPGFPDAHFSAELEQARLHERAKDTERAMAARQRWLDWNAGDYAIHAKVATWLAEQGRNAESEKLWAEANEVDPFRRNLHYSWGLALRALGRHAEALREFQVGPRVPLELDGDIQQGATEEMSLDELLELAGVTHEEWDALTPEERQQKVDEGLKKQAGDGAPKRLSGVEKRFQEQDALCRGYAALSALELGQDELARTELESALTLDPACPPALEARARLK